MKSTIFLCGSVICLTQACNENSFRGDSKPQPAVQPIAPYPSANLYPAPTGLPTTSSSPSPITTIQTIVSPTPKPGIVQPDGITLFDQCQACIDGAIVKSRSFQTSFIASKANAWNLGNYKNPVYCDIHFFRNLPQLGEPGVAEHSAAGGKVENSSEYPDQLIVYCPCNCNWNSPF
jgi:hypothetical protein